MSEIIDDLVVLGRAVPERLKDGRVTVCLGGWSYSRGFIRIYPTRQKMAISNWDVIRVEVERNEQDTREESWKLAGSKQDWDNLYQRVQKIGTIRTTADKRSIVTKNLSSCVNHINGSRRSLGIIRPVRVLDKYFAKNPQKDDPIQLFFKEIDDFEPWSSVKHDFDLEPRVKYACPECKTSQGYHDQKILEWGFYEWMRKHPDRIDQVWTNAKFESAEHEIFLFVGNQAHRRNSFLIISVIRLQRQHDQLTLW